MTALNINITKRVRARRQRSGALKEQPRYVLNFRHPRTRKRRQEFFERHKDALERRNALIAEHATGRMAADRSRLTVKEAVDRWLENKKGDVKARTLRGYRDGCINIVRPIVRGTRDTRAEYTRDGVIPDDVEVFPNIGDTRIQDLTPFDIRTWHKLVATEVGLYAANRAKMFLKAALEMAAEDFDLRLAVVPKTGRGRHKVKKAILMPEQVALVLKDAQQDRDRAVYLAFPFLTGVRPSEQLGLLWECIDFDANVIHIRRIQEDHGNLCEMTKTEAGRREIPMTAILRQLLLEWRVRCPRRGGELYRVFPTPGIVRAWPQSRIGGGGALTYANFRKRFWMYGLKRLGLPHVTPHSARHTFISTLQAQGVEVGLVAKLAGHANPTVTLGHYTQAVKGGAEAIQSLDRAFGG